MASKVHHGCSPFAVVEERKFQPHLRNSTFLGSSLEPSRLNSNEMALAMRFRVTGGRLIMHTRSSILSPYTFIPSVGGSKGRQQRDQLPGLTSQENNLKVGRRTTELKAYPSVSRISSSVFVSFLVNYSVIVSDWWNFKHTTKERLDGVIPLSGAAVPTVARSFTSSITDLPSRLLNWRGEVTGDYEENTLKGLEREGLIDGDSPDVTIDCLVHGDVPDVASVFASDLHLMDEIGCDIRDDKAAKTGKAASTVTAADDYASHQSAKMNLWLPSTNDAVLMNGSAQLNIDTTDFNPPLLVPSSTSMGFSFSAAGLLFPYHLGVSHCLIDLGYIRDDTQLSGASAGAIVCAVIASGVDMRTALSATKDLAKDCRENGTAFRLGAVLRKFLQEFLPEDAHIRSSGRISVAVTQVLGWPRGLLIDHFDSREDLINALITSSFVPGYLAPRPVTLYRRKVCVDGGLSQFMPPTPADETVKICAFPASGFGLRGIGISPDLNSGFKTSMRQMLTWALEPGEDELLEELYWNGYNDALTWAQQRQQMLSVPGT